MQTKHYCRPSTQRAWVTCESPICAGSVNFNGEDADHQVTIKNQGFATGVEDANDFTSGSWDTTSGGPNENS